MTSQNQQLVTILDWHDGGHHHTFLEAYAKAFLEIGRTICIGSLQPDWIKCKLEASGYKDGTDFVTTQIEKYPRPRANRNFKQRIRKWRRERRFIRSLENAIRVAEKTSNSACEDLHVACIYEHEAALLDRILDHLKKNTTGLYLQADSFHDTDAPQHADIFQLLNNRHLKVILTLDETAEPLIRERTTAKVLISPDLADTNTCPQNSYTSDINNQLGSKPKIALMGHLKKSKGLAKLCSLITENKLNEIGVIIAGDVMWNDFSEIERGMIETACSEHPNVWAHLSRISDETIYNSILECTDAILATYHKFPHSSNTLSKGAAFKKPIIANNYGVVAERIKKYRLGEVTMGTSPEDLLTTIRAIFKNFESWKDRKQPRWNQYLELHSHEALRDTLLKVTELTQQKRDTER